MAVTPIRPSFAAFRGPVDREGFEWVFELWQRVSQASHRLWIAAVTLPDRGHGALRDDLPGEFFRFPAF
jgi:hypothetical protein